MPGYIITATRKGRNLHVVQYHMTLESMQVFQCAVMRMKLEDIIENGTSKLEPGSTWSKLHKL